MSTIEELKKIARSTNIIPKKQKISDETVDSIINTINKNMKEHDIVQLCSHIDVWELTEEQNNRLYQAMPEFCQKKIQNYRKHMTSFMDQFGKDEINEERKNHLFQIVSMLRCGFPVDELEKDNIDFLLRLLGPTYLTKLVKLLQTENLETFNDDELQNLIEDE
jgi:hypothetical protein